MKNWITEQFHELNEVEKRFKRAFLNYPERHLDRPCTQKEVDDILKDGFLPLIIERHTEKNPVLSNEIPEGIFIPDDMDCGFLRHMRYMPAYWHTHAFFEVLFVLRGLCISTFSDGDVTLKKGDICIQAPGTSHALSAFDDDTIAMNILIRESTFQHTFIGILETDTIMSGFFMRAFMNTAAIPYLIFHTGDDPVITDDLERAFRESESLHRYRRQMVNCLMYELFLHLLQNHEKDLEAAHVTPKEGGDNLMYILRYMQEHWQTITLHELSSFFNYSDRQMQRIIQNATGNTFRENIRIQKMHRAAELLVQTSLPVGDIAARCGFDSPNNFRRTFHDFYGDTPQNYRVQHEEEQSRVFA